MGNCELQLFMAPTDVDTPRYISEAIGDQTRMVRVKSWRQRGWDAASIQERQEGIRLIRPEQIRMLGPDAAIALVRDLHPVRLSKVRYFEDRALNALYEGQKASAPLKDPGGMPEATLPGADIDGTQKGTTTELEETVRREPLPAPTVVTAETRHREPAAKLGAIKGKQHDLRSTVAAYCEREKSPS